MEEPKSGWRKTKKVGMKTYKLGRIICLTLAISMCLLEKYLAKIRITTILSGSTGSTEKIPKSNQLDAPLTVFPKISRAAKKKLVKTKKPASSSDLRKNRQSTRLKAKKTKTLIPIQNNCLVK